MVPSAAQILMPAYVADQEPLRSDPVEPVDGAGVARRPGPSGSPARPRSGPAPRSSRGHPTTPPRARPGRRGRGRRRRSPPARGARRPGTWTTGLRRSRIRDRAWSQSRRRIHCRLISELTVATHTAPSRVARKREASRRRRQSTSFRSTSNEPLRAVVRRRTAARRPLPLCLRTQAHDWPAVLVSISASTSIRPSSALALIFHSAPLLHDPVRSILSSSSSAWRGRGQGRDAGGEQGHDGQSDGHVLHGVLLGRGVSPAWVDLGADRHCPVVLRPPGASDDQKWVTAHASGGADDPLERFWSFDAPQLGQHPTDIRLVVHHLLPAEPEHPPAVHHQQVVARAVALVRLAGGMVGPRVGLEGDAEPAAPGRGGRLRCPGERRAAGARRAPRPRCTEREGPTRTRWPPVRRRPRTHGVRRPHPRRAR